MSLQNKKLDSCKLNSPIIKKKKSKCSRKFTITFLCSQASQQPIKLPPKIKKMSFHSQLSKGLISKKRFSVRLIIIIIKITNVKKYLNPNGFISSFISFLSFSFPFRFLSQFHFVQYILFVKIYKYIQNTNLNICCKLFTHFFHYYPLFLFFLFQANLILFSS